MHATQEIDKRVGEAKWYRRAASMDPRHSADVFARGVYNAFGKPYCVAAAVTCREAESMVSMHNGESL